MEYFTSSIKYLPSLTFLKLSCTGMTSDGFGSLSKGLASGLRFRNADQINNINVSLKTIFPCHCNTCSENDNVTRVDCRTTIH